MLRPWISSVVLVMACRGGAAPSAAPATLPASASIALSQPMLSLWIGETARVTVAGESSADDRSIAWASSNADVASVAKSGVITAKRVGAAVITATRGRERGSTRVWVSRAPVGSFAEYVRGCPSPEEIAFVRALGPITFEGDPTAGSLVCTAANGSADLTRLQARTYRILLGMAALRFTQPLPWTGSRLFEWFADQIKGIRYRNDITTSFCCEPPGVINIETGTGNFAEATLDDASFDGFWAAETLGLFIHEARHIAFGGHTCGFIDNTVAEEGAWGVQYQYNLALATQTPVALFSDIDRTRFKTEVWKYGMSRFCRETRQP